jgi:hypothetical protein
MIKKDRQVNNPINLYFLFAASAVLIINIVAFALMPR